MNQAKEEIKALLNNLPDNCTLEDVQYHLYVIEKIEKSIERTKKEGTISQKQAENRFKEWLSK